MSRLTLDSVSKVYPGGVRAVRGVSFECAEGEITALLGPSGCGKSSTMRMIAGLEIVSAGEIRLNGRRVNEATSRERNVSLAFESYALYSPLTVRENLAFPLESRGLRRNDVAARVQRVAEALRLTDILDEKPARLSGGQAQRVSLARALARDPDVLLLDEPLSHLDYRLRVELRARIRRLHEESGAATIYVTHDQEEAVALADKIVVMSDGKIMQIGGADSLWNRPANRFVAGFLGSPSMNFLSGSSDGAGGVVTPAGRIAGLRAPPDGGRIEIGFRPEDVTVAPPQTGDNHLAGTVVVGEYQGNYCILTVRTSGGRVQAITPVDREPAPEEQVSLVVDPACAHLFDPKTGAAISNFPGA